jgi:hypothetical protein
MNVQKVAYWKIYPCQAISENHWGRQAMKDLSEELGIGDLEGALFTSKEVAQEVAQRLLMKWDEAWPWSSEQRTIARGGVVRDARTTYQRYQNTSTDVVLTRGGEVCLGRLVKNKKTIVVEGEEYTRDVEVVILGEWEKKPEWEEVFKVETYRHEISVVS